jgi:hypothetical protein
VLTLFTTPVIYLWFDRIGTWFARRRATHPDQAHPAGRMPLPEVGA